MKNFLNIVGETKPVDESLEAFTFNPAGFTNGADAPLELVMHPFNGTRFKRVIRVMTVKERYRKRPEDEMSDDMTEEQIEAHLERDDRRTAEILARCCDGWNIHEDGKKLEFSVEAATELFFQVESLRKAVDEETSLRGKKKAKS